MIVNAHGGACCGMRHIFGFNSSGKQQRASLDHSLSLVPGSRVAEVVLTDSQCTKERMALLKEKGFRYVASFINGNTRRKLHIFHFYSGKTYATNTPPKNWIEQPAEEAQTAVSGE